MKIVLRLAAAMLAVLMLCISMTACHQTPPPTIINPVEEETGPVEPTVDDVFILYSTKLPWSDLENFIHTKTGDNTAHFDVTHKNGEKCALDVVIDPATGLLTEATITYKDKTQTLLTDDYMDLVGIIRAMSNATK